MISSHYRYGARQSHLTKRDQRRAEVRQQIVASLHAPPERKNEGIIHTDSAKVRSWKLPLIMWAISLFEFTLIISNIYR